MKIKTSFKFSYSFPTFCEQMPYDCYFIYEVTLLSKIRLRVLQKVHAWVHRHLQTASTHRDSSGRAHQQIGFSDQYFRQVSQKYLAPQIVTSKFCSIFIAYSSNHFHFMHCSILEIHVWSLFLLLEQLKNISS